MVMLTPENFCPRSQLSVVDGSTAEKVLLEHYELDPVRRVLAYKKVANKVEPVPTTMPATARIH